MNIKIRTDKGIISIFTYVLVRIGENKDINIDGHELSKENTTHLRKTIVGQKNIGWREMIQGFIYKGWTENQDAHYRSNGLNNRLYNIKRWKRMFLESLLEYVNKYWKVRNSAIHGDTKKEGRILRLERLQHHQVKELYKRKKEVRGTRYKQIFKIQMKKRVKFGVQALTLWVGKTEEVLKLMRETEGKHTIHRWLKY